jgi:hypothetical protein
MFHLRASGPQLRFLGCVSITAAALAGCSVGGSWTVSDDTVSSEQIARVASSAVAPVFWLGTTFDRMHVSHADTSHIEYGPCVIPAHAPSDSPCFVGLTVDTRPICVGALNQGRSPAGKRVIQGPPDSFAFLNSDNLAIVKTGNSEIHINKPSSPELLRQAARSVRPLPAETVQHLAPPCKN